MGLNLQGFAVSFKTKKPDVFAFHMSIEMPTNHETLDFERATSPSIEDNQVFITETQNGTIVTAGLDVPIDNVSFEKLSINGKALRFMIEETSMVFMYDYYENGELIRSVVNQEDMNVQEEGEPLDIEETETDCTAIITHLMALVTGESINTLALNTPSEKYEVSINS